ncbi:MAG: hypothetical protein O9325_21690 [Roseomonas sp.]|nr:hypothetical protein [Roseomonas sp.]
MPLAAGIALTAPDLGAVVLGPAWAGAGQAAQIVGCAALLGFIHGEPFSLFVARGQARWNLTANAAFSDSLALFWMPSIAGRPHPRPWLRRIGGGGHSAARPATPEACLRHDATEGTKKRIPTSRRRRPSV